MADMPRGTVTFLATDLEESTQHVQRLGQEYAELLGELRRLLRGAFAEHEGWEVDTQGDAFFVAFERVRDAVLAAAMAQPPRTGRGSRLPGSAWACTRPSRTSGRRATSA
jgi:class 3 adenylate cyclase